MTKPVRTPEPPYYAVIFTSRLTPETGGYEETAQRMVELAEAQPGFLGIESARGEDGLGISVSYWTDEDAIAAWRRHAEHLVAQRHGMGTWYAEFFTRVARVERANHWERDAGQ